VPHFSRVLKGETKKSLKFDIKLNQILKEIAEATNFFRAQSMEGKVIFKLEM
jgi:hypothetical protein